MFILLTISMFSFLGFDCRKRWFQLRDCFRKAYQKRINTPDGQTAKKTRPWRYESVMEFIIPHMAERKQFSSNDVESDESIDSFRQQQYTFDGAEGETEESQDVQTQLAEGRITPQRTTEENSAFPGSSQCNKTRSIGHTPSIVKCNNSRSFNNREKDKYKRQPVVSTDLQEYLYTTKDEEAATVDDDVLATFFKAMEKTVRTFSIPLQIETKRKISNLINDCELKNYMEKTAATINSGAFGNQMRQLSSNSANLMPSITDSSLSNLCPSSMPFPTHMKHSPSSVHSCNSSDANRIDTLIAQKRPNSDEDESGFSKQSRHDS